MIQKDKIVFLGDFSFPFGSAAGSRIKNLLEAFLAIGLECYVWTLGDIVVESNELASEKLISCVINQGSAGRAKDDSRFFKSLRHWWKFNHVSVEKIKKLRIMGVSYVYLYGSLISALPIAKRLRDEGFIVVIDQNEAPESFEGQGSFLNPNYWNFRLGFYHLFKAVEGVCSITHVIRGRLRIDDERCLVVPSVEDFSIQPEDRLGCNKTIPTFLYLGRFLSRDLPGEMLRLMFALHTLGLDFKMNLVGNIDHGSDYYRKWDELCRSDPEFEAKINFCGRIDDIEVRKLLRESHFAIILRREHLAERASFPTRLVEYLKYGCCVISSAVGDIPMYFTKGSDILFYDKENPDETVKEITSLANAPSEMKAFSQRSFQNARARFDRGKHCERLLEFFRKFNN